MTLLAGLDFSTLPQQLVNGLQLGAIYALIALGYTMVYGVLKLINFAHGEVYMFGGYVALFLSWFFGFAPESTSKAMSSPLYLVGMLLGSMVICGLLGLVIERFAYRPMRNQSRIASLITAIGVSMLLQYGGALFLPNSPPPSIDEHINPYRNPISVPLLPRDGALKTKMDSLQAAKDQTKTDFDGWLKTSGEGEFQLSAKGTEIRDKMRDADRAYSDAKSAYEKTGLEITVQQGQAIIFVTALLLMLALRFLVMKTPAGRAMRAVSLDFDSASLMGINVDRIIVLTFFIGSALAGAGAMMIASFFGTPLTTFFGMQPGVKAFVAAVLGGIGNIPGAVLGGILMGVAETLVVWMGYSSYRDAIAFVVLIVILLFRPGGLLGSSKVEKV